MVRLLLAWGAKARFLSNHVPSSGLQLQAALLYQGTQMFKEQSEVFYS